MRLYRCEALASERSSKAEGSYIWVVFRFIAGIDKHTTVIYSYSSKYIGG